MKIFAAHTLLQPYIYNYIHIQKEASDNQQLFVDFFPHGYPTIIYNIGHQHTVIQNNGEQVEGLFTLNGQFDKHVAYHTPAANIIIINCKPYGAYYLFHVNMKPLLNTFLEISSIRQGDILWMNNLKKLSQPNLIIQEIEQRLLQHIPPYSSKVFHMLNQAVDIIQTTHGNIPIPALCKRLNTSISSLEAHFNEKIGISPKRYARIVRFNHCYKYMLQHPSLSWTDIAYQFEYADQVHFIKEFKHFMGCAPSQLRSEQWIISESITSSCV